MWVPNYYARGAADWDSRLIEQNPFGLLVSVDQGQGRSGEGLSAPVATPVPLLIHPDDRAASTDGLEGIRLLGHLARLNPQWHGLRDGDPVLAIFQGPDAYISPALYPDRPAAPTWNYATVHAGGPIRLIHDEAEMMRIIDLTIDVTEGGREPGWDREDSRGYFAQIIRGVVAFEVLVDRVDASYKLSQDQHPERRRSVAGDAAASGDSRRREMGAWMGRAEAARRGADG